MADMSKSKVVNQPVPERNHLVTSFVRIAVDKCEKNDDGTWTLMFEGPEVAEQDRETIRRLLPDLAEQFYALLDKQALFARIK